VETGALRAPATFPGTFNRGFQDCHGDSQKIG
jgi:hypothetical protein